MYFIAHKMKFMHFCDLSGGCSCRTERAKPGGPPLREGRRGLAGRTPVRPRGAKDGQTEPSEKEAEVRWNPRQPAMMPESTLGRNFWSERAQLLPDFCLRPSQIAHFYPTCTSGLGEIIKNKFRAARLCIQVLSMH